jgi:hypothetical protein
MCRDIKTLRAPYAVGVTDEDVRAAALQYVRTVGGFRLPNPANEEAFNRAVEAVIAATQTLLASLGASPDPSSVLAGRVRRCGCGPPRPG